MSRLPVVSDVAELSSSDIELSQTRLEQELPSLDVYGGGSPLTFSLNENALTRELLRRSRHRTRKESRYLPNLADHQVLDPGALWDYLELRERNAPNWSSGRDVVRVADLFSGMGAMSLGVGQAARLLGMACRFEAAFEVDPIPLSVYVDNFHAELAEPLDLSDVLQDDLGAPLNAVERRIRDRLEGVDIMVAGPPCQGHSNLNNVTRRRDPKNGLYLLVARFAKVVRPRLLIVENVLTVQHDKGNVVRRTIAALEALRPRYYTDSGIVDLWRLGVPQSRRRHVLVATRSDEDRAITLRQIIDRYEVRPRPIDWAIGDLPERGGEYLHTPNEPKADTSRRIAYLFDNGLYDLPDSERPSCHRDKRHSYRAVYGRLKWGRLSPTITGGFDTMGRGRYVHPAYRRTLTPQEALRLQGIPDYFAASGLRGNRRTLTETIGNAVPPRLSFVIALEYLR